MALLQSWTTTVSGWGSSITQFVSPALQHFNPGYGGGPDFSNYFRGFGGSHTDCFNAPDVRFNRRYHNPPTSVQAGPCGNDNINVNPDQYRHMVNAQGRGGNDNITVNKSHGFNKNINVDGGAGFDSVKLQGGGLQLSNIGMSWDKQQNRHVKTYQFTDPRGNRINVRNAEQLLLDRNGDGQGTALNLGAMESSFYAARARGEAGINMDQFEAQQSGNFGS